MKKFIFVLCLVFLGFSQVIAQESIGIFDDHQDVGEPSIPGFANYNEDDGVYSVDAVGETIGDESYVDQFHYVFSEMSGSFAIEGSPIPVGIGRGGLMIRQDLDADSVHVSFLMMDDFTVQPAFRTLEGGGSVVDGETDPAGLHENHSGKIRLEKLGNSIHIYTFNEDGDKVLFQTQVVPFENTVMAGLAATADTGDDFGLFDFEEVVIEELPLSVFRSLPTTEFEAGATLNSIEVTAQVREGETVNAVINERVPYGAEVVQVEVTSGEYEDNGDGTIEWTLSDFSGEATLTYDLVLGEGATAVWQGTFSDGVNLESYIGGDTILPKTPAYDPHEAIEVDPFLPTIIQGEWGTAIGDPGFGLMVDPRLRSGVYFTAMDEFSTEQIVEFTFNVPEDGTYYIFGNVRAEDGTSDSFYTNVDFLPESTEADRWNISSRKSFSREWLSSNEPALDPRPFELTAGEHFLYLASREQSASLDWIAVTNDPNLDLDTFDMDVRGSIARTIDQKLLDPGEMQTTVELEAYIATGVAGSVTVHEMPPAGLEVSEINPFEGTFVQNADGSIDWDLTGVTGIAATLEYTVTAQSDDPNIFHFTGSMTVGGDVPLNITGDSYLGKRTEPIDKTVYFIRRISENNQSDMLTMLHLQVNFGVTINDYDDTNMEGHQMPNDLTGADMMYASETIGSGNVASMNYHVGSEVPIVTSEAYLFDDFTNQPGENFGTQDDNEIEIVDNEHPITEGLPLGVMQVWEDEMWMGYLENPPAGVRVLATEPSNPNHARLWVIEPGETVNGQPVPGMRIGTFLQNNGFAALNDDGLNLIYQVFAYALDTEPPVSVEDFMLY